MEDRFSLLLKAKNITASKLADEIKVQRSAISHILSGRNKPSLDLLQKIFETFPDLSPDWLINGKGAMFRVSTDLFSGLNESIPSHKMERPERVTKASLVVPQNESITDVKESIKTVETLENKGVEHANKDKSEQKAQKYSSVIEKEIEKILIFYTDRTFKEYNPSD